MKPSNLKIIFCILMLFTSNMVFAKEPKPSATHHANRLIDWFNADIYRVSVGFGGLKLQNPKGFDVPIDTYNDGFSDSASAEVSFDVVGERAIGWQGRQKRLWNFHYDGEDFNGLQLHSVSLGTGVAIDPARAFAFGGRLAVGANVGLTRSSTFFDNTIHPAAELWASAGVQLGRFAMDISVRERQALGVSLDDRRAAPRTQTRMISLGWLF